MSNNKLDATRHPQTEACTICGITGYWVAYDTAAHAYRCINHYEEPIFEDDPKPHDSQEETR